jgi:hypothetical protein
VELAVELGVGLVASGAVAASALLRLEVGPEIEVGDEAIRVRDRGKV